MNCHSDNMHMGDAIFCLIAMSRLPGSHTLRCNPVYHTELRGLVEGLPIAITGMEGVPRDSYNCWIASGQFAGIHYADDIDILGFVMRYFNAMTSDAGFGPVFKAREDLLCDFPSIKKRHIPNNTFDILVINADPKSGQCPRYSSSEMDALITRLKERHHVTTIEGMGYSMVEIGRMAREAMLIVGCATGPIWPTFLTCNKEIKRHILLDPMRLDFGASVRIEHSSCASELSEKLEKEQWL